MVGIYKFTNKITGECYIGQSVNLQERFHQHRRNHVNPNSHSYNTTFYKKLREYGFENFDYEILYEAEFCSQAELNEKERYWVDFYDSYYNGYNMNPGGDATGGNYFIPKAVVLEIKELLKNNPEISMTELANRYNISSVSIISSINHGISYRFVGDYIYPIRDKEQTITQVRGGNNGRALFTDEEVMAIRKEFVNKDLDTIYAEYKDRISFSAMKKIVYGVHFQHLPCYKKKKKQWYLNGSCIDYPYDEE